MHSEKSYVTVGFQFGSIYKNSKNCIPGVAGQHELALSFTLQKLLIWTAETV